MNNSLNAWAERHLPTLTSAKSFKDVALAPLMELNWAMVLTSASVAFWSVMAALLRTYFGIAGGILAKVALFAANTTCYVMVAATIAVIGYRIVNKLSREG